MGTSRSKEKKRAKTSNIESEMLQEYMERNRNNSKIGNLPNCLFPIVGSFLRVEDYRRLMITSKKEFKDIRKQSVYFNLNKMYSQNFLYNPLLMQQKVNKFEQQISLKLTQDFIIANMNIKIPVNQIETTWRKKIDFSCFVGVPKLRIIGEDDQLQIVWVNLQGAYLVRFMENFPSTVTHLYLENFSNLNDISNLNNLVEVTLCDCPQLVDVSPLRNAQKIKLKKFWRLQDISSLFLVPSLTLEDCRLVESYSNLRNRSISVCNCESFLSYDTFTESQNITLTGNTSSRLVPQSCYQVKWNNLKNFRSCLSLQFTKFHFLDEANVNGDHQTAILPPLLKRLTFAHCPSILNDSFLYGSHLTFLSLQYCENIENLSMIGNIPVVELIACRKIRSLEGLGPSGNRKVRISSQNITDFTPLSGIEEISLFRCPGLMFASELKNCRKIHLEECYNIDDLSPLLGIQDEVIHVPVSLTIKSCQSVKSISGCDRIKFLEIDHCEGITSLNNFFEYKEETFTNFHANEQIKLHCSDWNRIQNQENISISTDYYIDQSDSQFISLYKKRITLNL